MSLSYGKAVVCLSVCPVFTFSNVFSSGTTGPIEVPGQTTKMAAMPIYDKNPSKIFSGTAEPICMKFGM